jgi:hypothetical protein
LSAGLDRDTRMRLDARLATGGVGLRVMCCAGFELVMSCLPARFGAGSGWLAALGHLVAGRNLLEGVRMAVVGGVLRAGTDLSAFGAAGGGRRGQNDRYRKGRTQHGRRQATPAHGLFAAHRAGPGTGSRRFRHRAGVARLHFTVIGASADCTARRSGAAGLNCGAGIGTRPGMSSSPGWPAHSKPSMLMASAPRFCAWTACRTDVHLWITLIPASAVEHRVRGDMHGSTVLVSIPPRLRSRAAVTSLLAPNIAARERSSFPGQPPWRRDPRDLR